MHQKGNRMSSKDLRALFDIMLIKTDAGFLLFPRNVKSRKLAISLLLLIQNATSLGNFFIGNTFIDELS